jgi:hypothetical protein
MLEMANQEHPQFGWPVAATYKSSTDVTSAPVLEASWGQVQLISWSYPFRCQAERDSKKNPICTVIPFLRPIYLERW